MRQGVKNLQSEKVNELVTLYYTEKKEITFKSPTGSGKTYMMASFMDKVLDAKTIFIVSSLSKGQLAEQNHEKFLEYSQSDFANINSFLINSSTTKEEKLFIPLNYNVYSLPRDLYKKNSRLMEGSMLAFLKEIQNLGKKIVLIKDECHQATNNLDQLNSFFYKTLNVSATPQQTRFHIDVELTEDEAIEEKLIKVNQNPANNSPYTLDEQLKQLKEEAIPLFLEIKREYNQKMKINPAMIIQISNKTKGEEEWLRIKEIIDNPSLGLKWMYIVDESSKQNDTNDNVKKLPISKWKFYAKSNEALIDIIVFKMVITEGWDIPRACMLFQVRDTESVLLDEQVYGRVRRNPILVSWSKYEKDVQDLALKCWVWGMLRKENRVYKKVNLNKKYDFLINTTILKDLQNNPNFNINDFMATKSNKIITEDVFSLYKKWHSITEQTNNLSWTYIKTYSDWFKISQYILEINSKNNEYLKNYNESMTIGKAVGLPDESYYEKTKDYLEINDWMWENHSKKDDEFHFDSETEKEFAKILRNTKNAYFGKNYYPNSELYFEYFDGGIKKSYPDFVLKDKNNKIHIFEVKSLNKKMDSNISTDEYTDKIEEIADCFKFSSKTTPYIFYIPIKERNNWVIRKFESGIANTIVLEELIDSLTS